MCFFSSPFSLVQDLAQPLGKGGVGGGGSGWLGGGGGAALSANHKVCAKPLDSNAPN